MSTENVMKLLALSVQDAGLRAQIQACGADEAGAKAMVALGQTRGLAFTAADVLKVIEAAAKHRDTPLSEGELAKVSGGRDIKYQATDAVEEGDSELIRMGPNPNLDLDWFTNHLDKLGR